MTKIRVKGIFILSLFTVLFCLMGYSQKTRSVCKSAPPNQMTAWGRQNIILKEPAVLKNIRGKVIAGEKPLAGVLVEIYDHPEGLLKDWKEREAMKAKQNRIAACITDVSGIFSFQKLPAGKYEVRFSGADDWDSTSIYTIVNPKNPRSKSKKLMVRMQVGQ